MVLGRVVLSTMQSMIDIKTWLGVHQDMLIILLQRSKSIIILLIKQQHHISALQHIVNCPVQAQINSNGYHTLTGATITAWQMLGMPDTSQNSIFVHFLSIYKFTNLIKWLDLFHLVLSKHVKGVYHKQLNIYMMYKIKLNISNHQQL